MALSLEEGGAPSFLSPREGFLEEGADLNVWRGEEGTHCGQRDQGEQKAWRYPSVG